MQKVKTELRLLTEEHRRLRKGMQFVDEEEKEKEKEPSNYDSQESSSDYEGEDKKEPAKETKEDFYESQQTTERRLFDTRNETQTPRREKLVLDPVSEDIQFHFNGNDDNDQ